MAIMGQIRIDILGLDRARLLVIELNELEKDLRAAKQVEFADRVNHALRRFTNTGSDPKSGSDSSRP